MHYPKSPFLGRNLILTLNILPPGSAFFVSKKIGQFLDSEKEETDMTKDFSPFFAASFPFDDR